MKTLQMLMLVGFVSATTLVAPSVAPAADTDKPIIVADDPLPPPLPPTRWSMDVLSGGPV